MARAAESQLLELPAESLGLVLYQLPSVALLTYCGPAALAPRRTRAESARPPALSLAAGRARPRRRPVVPACRGRPPPRLPALPPPAAAPPAAAARRAVPRAAADALAGGGVSRKRVPRWSHGVTAMARAAMTVSRSTNGEYSASSWSCQRRGSARPSRARCAGRRAAARRARRRGRRGRADASVEQHVAHHLRRPRGVAGEHARGAATGRRTRASAAAAGGRARGRGAGAHDLCGVGAGSDGGHSGDAGAAARHARVPRASAPPSRRSPPVPLAAVRL